MKTINKALSRLHTQLSRSRLVTKTCLLIKNQCELILRQRFGCKNMNPELNGEYFVLKRILPHCQVIFDVGANKGEWTNYILEQSSHNPTLILFEPGLQAFKMLQSRFGDHKDIQLNNLALSDTTGFIEFYEESNAGEMSSALKGWSHTSTEVIQAQTTTIDEELGKSTLPFIDLLKIDVEGFDLKVMLGAENSLREEKIGIIQFEYNSAWYNLGSSLHTAYSLLQKYNYSVFIIEPDGLYIYDVQRFGDFFTFSNFLAVSAQKLSLVKDLIRGNA